jgi:hypothetical protein
MKKSLLLAFLLVASACCAVTLPKVWVASETIKAADLNANFNALKNAYNMHGSLSELDYTDAKHTNFQPEGGNVLKYDSALQFVDPLGQLFPIQQVTVLPVASSVEYGALYLYRGPENVLYVNTGNATGVPTMTGYTAPYGEVLYSGAATGYQGWKAFDGDATTYWQSETGMSEYIGYKFVASKTVNAVWIQPYEYADNNVYDFTVDYSDNGTTWTSVATYTDTAPPVVGVELYVASTTPHLYWRLNVSDAYTTNSTDYLKLTGVDFREYTKTMTAVTVPGFAQGITATFTLPYEFGVSSWTLGIANGFVASITTP